MNNEHLKLLEANKVWSKKHIAKDSEYFINMAKGQSPNYLWIGCADSRVSTSRITGTIPGEVFVHRNIANMVVHTDLNLLSVILYAVKVLKVNHIIVCGHYGCGGIKAALTHSDFEIVNKWIRNIKEVYEKHEAELVNIDNEDEKADRLAEFNVIEQVINLAKTSIVQEAWKERELQIHGWIYGIGNGMITDLKCTISNKNQIHEIYRFD